MGSLLAAGAVGPALWRAASSRPRALRPDPAERLDDGRSLVRGAALAFGTTVSIAAVHGDPALASDAIQAALREVRAVDALMTVFRPDSQIGRLNRDGTLSDPHPHVVRVLEVAQRVSALSAGTFDVTVQPLWLLAVRCRREGRRPEAAEIDAARARVGWQGLEVTPRRIAFARPGMSVTLNGIAQGFATDLAMTALREHGVQDALLDTGEMGAEGRREPGHPWTVGIQHPRRPGEVLGSVTLEGCFLATTGDYATAFTPDFVSHHVFDPRTGRSPPGLSSAVVMARSGVEADALTKPMMILDRVAGRTLLERFPGAGAVWIDKNAAVVDAVGVPLVPVG